MKICYLTLHGAAEWVDVKEDNDYILHLQFTPKCNGAISLGNVIFEVKEGNVSIPFNALQNGEYHPKLEADTGVFVVEGFSKSGYVITMLKTDESLIRRLVLRCHTLEKLCGTLTERVAHLEAICQGHKIFDYERME